MMQPLSWTAPPDLPDTHYLDNRIYTDPALFDAEMERIFATRWKLVCHGSEIAAAGDFQTFQLAGRRLFVLHGYDGEVRCFLNVCPHRGATLIRQPAGNLGTDRVRCFYHLWAFDSTGRCRKIPRQDGYATAGLSEDSVGLRGFRTERRFGFIWVCLDDAAEPIDDFLAPVAAELEPVLSGGDIDVFHIHRAEFRANWKMFVETNCDGYHELLHVLNRTTGLGQREYADRKWRTHARGHNSFEPFEIGYRRLGLESRSSNLFPGMGENGHLVTDIFPDTMINIRATVGRIDTLMPLAPDRTILECRGIGLKGDTPAARAARVKQHNQVWGPCGRNLPEDLWAIESQWRNMAGGGQRYSIIAREEDSRAMDDATLRNFYGEWSRLVARYPHDISAEWRGPADENG